MEVEHPLDERDHSVVFRDVVGVGGETE